MMSARSASVSCTRLPDSNITSVASIRDSSASRGAARGLLATAKIPRRKTGRSAAPRPHSAASTEDGPGSAITAWPAAQTSRTSLKPGSEISGVPASDTSAIEAPCASFSQDFRPRQRGVVLVIGLELRRDAVALGQPAGDAGVLAGDDVDAGQRFQRAQGDVAEIADRGRHQMQPGNRPSARSGHGRPSKMCAADGSGRPSGVFVEAGFARIMPI